MLKFIAIFYVIYYLALFIAMFFGYRPSTFTTGVALLQSAILFGVLYIEEAN